MTAKKTPKATKKKLKQKQPERLRLPLPFEQAVEALMNYRPKAKRPKN